MQLKFIEGAVKHAKSLPMAIRPAGRKFRTALGAAIAAVALDAMCGPLAAETATTAVQPFAEFVQDLSTAPANAFVGLPVAAVSDETAFEEMRRHLINLYGGMAVSHSFARGGQVLDCVPILQQPAVRLQGLKEIAEPPPRTPAASWMAETLEDVSSALPQQGQAEQCEDGTVPMRRITLDQVARFKTLQHFLGKGPDGAGYAPAVILPSVILSDGSSHAHVGERQYVKNYGGYSVINVWQPGVYTDAPYNEELSLAQQWYIGAPGTSNEQTAEVGWQVYPAYYGDSLPHLFTYWTADLYATTGCYNTDCGAFVTTSSTDTPGEAFSPVSTYGGTQYDIGLGFYLYKGNWWLAFRHTNSWIGYYPGSLYVGGQLSRFAQVIQFGGETATQGYWPFMGSGAKGAPGYGYQAYQERIIYRDSKNVGHTPSLLSYTDTHNKCYLTSTTPAAGGTGWGTYFYFGGPGGKPGAC